MSEIPLLIKSLDSAMWEMSEAFKGLPDADVWKRADDRLLSVGELATHVVFWEAASFFGEQFESPLVNTAGRYYTSSVAAPFVLPIDSTGLFNEVKRIHEACRQSIVSNPPDPQQENPHRKGWTWEYTLIYQAFHVAYHTGQIYSVRHLLGHQTEDN